MSCSVRCFLVTAQSQEIFQPIRRRDVIAAILTISDLHWNNRPLPVFTDSCTWTLCVAASTCVLAETDSGVLLFWCWYQKSHCLWCLLWSVLIPHYPLQWNIYILSADLILTGFYGSVCSRDIRPLCRDLTLWTWRLSRKFVEKPAVQHSVFPCLHSFSVGLNELRRFLPAFCLKAHCLIPFFFFVFYEADSSKRQRALVSVF